MNNKYHKYKSKYINLKTMMCGGTLEKSNDKLKHEGLNIKHNFTPDAKIIGEGGYGIIVYDTKSAFKLIKHEQTCKNSSNEFSRHFNVYMTFSNIGRYIDTLEFKEIYDLSYIPKPISFYDYPTPTKIAIGERNELISCLYEMEYMEPADITENICDGLLLPLHVAISPVSGCYRQRGYFVSTLKQLRTNIDRIEVKYAIPNINAMLFKILGFTFGCAWLGAGYNPRDFQFMISKVDGKIRIVGFDFGEFYPISFEEILEFKSNFYDDFIFSQYGFSLLVDDTREKCRNNILEFLTGMAYVVRVIKKLTPDDIRIRYFDTFINTLYEETISYGDEKFVMNEYLPIDKPSLIKIIG
jgi:hypothetical protein